MREQVLAKHPDARLMGYADDCWIQWSDGRELSGLYETETATSSQCSVGASPIRDFAD